MKAGEKSNISLFQVRTALHKPQLNLGYVIVFNATFNNISVILWRWRKPEKTTDLS